MRGTTLRRRLDAELVRRGLATGRDQAKRLIEAGVVLVDGAGDRKAATMVAADSAIVITDAEGDWASRGALKLAAALETFSVDPTGARALDVGASTGGFTDVLLRSGAAHVTAVDVGYGQMVWRLVQDARVRVIDRTNFRTIDTDSLDGPFDLVVVDVSFISVALLADNLVAAGRPGTRYVILVKPQFEVGRERVGAGGIVTDLDARADAIIRVSASLASRGVACQGIMRSPITGAKGNVEFLLDGTLGEPRELEIARIQEVVGI